MGGFYHILSDSQVARDGCRQWRGTSRPRRPTAACSRQHVEFGRTSEAPLRTTQRVSRSSVVTQAEGDSEAARAVRDVYNSLREMMERAQRDEQRPAMSVYTRDLSYHPPGCDAPLLSRVNLELPPRSLGLIYGRSGAGKTTLLHLLAGLSEPTEGLACVCMEGEVQAAMPAAARGERAGVVFQFPERHFVGSSIHGELTLSWPRNGDLFQRQVLAQRLFQVLGEVGIDTQRFPLDTDPRALSDGFKRRLALAAQLIRGPGVLMLDEPLAGLDWEVRKELVSLLRDLKTRCSLLVVSHDLREIAPLVDVAWEMMPGGQLEQRDPSQLPFEEVVL